MSRSLPLLVLVALLGGLALLVLWTRDGAEPVGSVAGGPGDQPLPSISDPAPLPVSGDLATVSATVDFEVVGRLLFEESSEVQARLSDGTRRIDVGAVLLDRDAARDGVRTGRQLVRFRLADGSSLCRSVTLREEFTAEMDCGPRRMVAGIVRDGGGAVVRGAELWAGEIGADDALRTVSSDDEGRFEIDVPAGESVPLVVRARGFASVLTQIDVGHDGVRDLTVRLEPATRIDLVLGASVIAPSRARYRLRPVRSDTAASAYPLCFAALQHRDSFDESGHAVIDDLPDAAALSVSAVHPDAGVARSVQVTTGRRAQRSVVLVIAPGEAVRGVVTDAQGAPVAAIAVRCGEATTSTDAAGSFGIAVGEVQDAPVEFTLPGGARLVVAAARLRRFPRVELPASLRRSDDTPRIALRAVAGVDRFRARHRGGGWTEIAPGATFDIDLEGPAVVDLRVRWFRGENGAVIERRFERLTVVGRVELAIPD